MQRGFKRTDYRIERKNKFVNLESFFAVDGNASSAAFRHSPAKDLPRRLDSSSEIIIKLYVDNKTTNYSLQ